ACGDGLHVGPGREGAEEAAALAQPCRAERLGDGRAGVAYEERRLEGERERLGDPAGAELGLGGVGQRGVEAVEVSVEEGMGALRSEEQRLNSSHVKNSYGVFCLKKKLNYR